MLPSFLLSQSCERVAGVERRAGHERILIHIKAAVVVGNDRVRLVRVARAEVGIGARPVQLEFREVIAAQRQLAVGNDMPLAEQTVRDSRRLAAHLCVIDERGGAAVVRLDLEGWHYVLLTRIEGGDVYLFDPYYHEGPFDNAELRVTDEHPCSYNRIVPVHYFEREEISVYSLGPFDTREAILLFNTDTELTEDKTVEYFI